MAKPFIAIGITTYRDISAASFGARFYDACHSVSPKIVPTRAGLTFDRKEQVNISANFAERWSSEVTWRTLNKDETELLDKFETKSGAEWRCTGPSAGRGRVTFNGRDPNGCHTLEATWNYLPNVDWAKLFQSLIPLFQPSYAMLHLFTEQEISAVKRHDKADFDGPVVHENRFARWRTVTGAVHRPDPWQLEARRTYRHLPQLSWSNFLGPQFRGQFDHAHVIATAAKSSTSADGMHFETTPSIASVATDYAQFWHARNEIRKAFMGDFFWS